MRGKRIDRELVAEFCARMNRASSKRERGAVMRWFREATGVSKNTAYGILEAANEGIPHADIIAGKQRRAPRKSEFEREQEKRHALIIAAIKRLPGEHAKPIPTELAIPMAENRGLIPAGKYTRCRADRLLKTHQLNTKSVRLKKAARPITARYPGHVFVVDATPIDHYYLTLDMRVKPYDTPEGDKHLDDLLAREGLYKIWVYCLVDMHTKAFLLRPFAGLPKNPNSRNRGENSEDWIDFLRWAFLPKHGTPSPLADKKAPLADCPIEGAPTILWCDQGSGIGGNTLVNRMCLRMGVEVKTHFPGNPRAKGVVESRFSAFKRRYEPLIRKNTITNINELIYFYQAWADYHNRAYGFYDAWQHGVREHPIVRVSPQNLHDAMVSNIVRTINSMGCVSIDGEEWFAAFEEKYLGTKCTVYRAPERAGERRYFVELFDRTIRKLVPASAVSHDFEEIKSFPKTELERNRDEARELSKSIGQYVSFDDTLPPDDSSKVIRFPSPAVNLRTHSPVVPEQFQSAESARAWLLNQTGLFLESIPANDREKIEGAFSWSMDKLGYISGSVVLEFANVLNQHKSSQHAQEEV
ncbi:MAG TPA: hypothetical protein PK875_03770 [Spirochaetota bacterium]|nr:MAG: Integrase core domain protein [Spirochaetes bacterium ADurb.BinA120]HPI13639.1 hypothetical protein [Spirochaetota bacterium]HPO44894.1 hypothetical protein [Spirochaetota bacterium]